MRSKFSTAWNSSVKPRKQRKYNYNAPLHIRHKFLNAHLSKALKEKYGKRSLPLRTGDEVLVMRGAFKKKKAKVASIDIKKTRITLEGIQRSKKDGTKIPVFFHPSVLKIEFLDSEDKLRFKQNTEKKNASKKKSGNN